MAENVELLTAFCKKCNDGTLAHFTKRIIVDKDAQTLVNESIAFYNAGKYQEGIESNTKALQLKPDYALAYNNICVGNNNLARWDEAIKACLKAIELNPNFTLAQNNLAYAKRMAK